MKIEPTRFAAPQRFLHWLMAVCILTMLFLGVGMVTTIAPKYLTLIKVHEHLGIGILALVLLRLALRIHYGAPPLPANLPLLDRLAGESSQYILYAFMLAMPLLGWGMLSAASHPVILSGGIHLPPIAPVNASLFSFLRRAHDCMAFAFFALILMHVAALLFHKLVRKDGIFETMAP